MVNKLLICEQTKCPQQIRAMGKNTSITKSMGNKLLILIPGKILAWKPEYSINEVLMGGISLLVIGVLGH